jgi:DNA-binding MarR family transcriptional regulator
MSRTTGSAGAATTLDVDDELLSALQRLGRLMSSRRVAADLADAAGTTLSPQGIRILRTLRRDGRLPIARLAASSEMDLAAVSRQLRSLEGQGLVVRSPAPDDQRVHLVALSRRGRAVADRLRRVGVQHLSDSLADWSAEDRRQVAHLLGRLVDDLRHTDVRSPRPPGRPTTTKEP